MDAILDVPRRPAKVRNLGSPSSGDAKKLGSPLDAAATEVGITLVELVLLAAKRAGVGPKDLQALFRLPESEFSKAFSLDPQWADRNRLMKVPLPRALARCGVAVLAEELGLQRDAAMHIVRAMGDFLTVTVATTPDRPPAVNE